MIVKTEKEMNSLKKSGKALECVLTEIKKKIKEGMSTMDISILADELFKKNNIKSAFLDYKPDGAETGFPSRVCVSVNEEIAHGVPKKEKILKPGDVVSVDCGLKINGFSCGTLPIPCPPSSETTKKPFSRTKLFINLPISFTHTPVFYFFCYLRQTF